MILRNRIKWGYSLKFFFLLNSLWINHISACAVSGGSWSSCTADEFIHSSTKCTDGNCESSIENTTTTGYLYYCTAEDSCQDLTSTNGYYYKGTTAYSCTGSSQCKKVALSESCTGNTVGTLLLDAADSTKLAICLNAGVAVTLTEGENYIVGYGSTDAPFGLSSGNYAILKLDSTSVEGITSIAVDTSGSGITYTDTNYKIVNLAGIEDCSEVSLLKKFFTLTNGVASTATDFSIESGENYLALIDTNKYCKASISDSTIIFAATTLQSTADTAGYLYQCLKGENNAVTCSEITARGFYVNSFSDLYSCEGATNTCKKKAAISAENCGTNTDLNGSLIKNTDGSKLFVCLNYDNAEIKAELKDDAGQYIVAYGSTSGSIYGLSTSTDYAVITVTSTSVVLKTISNNGNYVAVSNTLALVTEPNVTGDLYECSSTGSKCTKQDTLPTGYLVNAGDTSGHTIPYLECSTTNSNCKAISATVAAACTSSIGKIIKASKTATDYSFCVNAATALPLATTTGSYLISINTQNSFGSQANGFVPIALASDGSVTKETTITDGYFLINSSNAVLSDAGTGSLYSCSNSDGYCQIASAVPIGYLINGGVGTGNAPYIKCSLGDNGTTKACETITVTAEACSTAKVGGLIKSSGTTYKLCFDESTSAVELSTSVTSSTYYMIGISGAGNIFGKQDNGYVKIDLKDGHAIKQEITTSGHYLADKTNFAIITTASVGDLYDCDGTSKVCTKNSTPANLPIGYLPNAGNTDTLAIPYIKCTLDPDDSANNKCEAIAVTGSCSKIGDVIKVSDNYKLCFKSSGSDGVDLSSVTTTSYLIDVGNTIAFGKKASSFTKIDIGNGKALLHGKDANPERYEFTDVNNAVINQSTFDVSQNCSNGSVLSTYKINEYRLTDTTSDKTNYYESV